jgi:hypothetical protein
MKVTSYAKASKARQHLIRHSEPKFDDNPKYITGTQLAEADLMYRVKKMDTLDIALALGLGWEAEPIVWRSLQQRRDQWRKMRAATKKMAAAS